MTMKPVDVKQSTYINSNKERNYQDPKLKIGDIVRISIDKKKLQQCIFQIGLEKFLWLKKLKALFCGHMLLKILKEKKNYWNVLRKGIAKNKSESV